MTDEILSTEALGLNDAWPLHDVLARLISASEHLLNKKSYDGPDYEEIQISVQKGKEYLKKLKEKQP